MIDVVAAVFLIAGTGFLIVSALGLTRFPDFWTRAHAVAKAETLGLVLVFIGLIVLNRFGAGSLQLALIATFSLLVNPTAIHALARSASRGRVPLDAGDGPVATDVAPDFVTPGDVIMGDDGSGDDGSGDDAGVSS